MFFTEYRGKSLGVIKEIFEKIWELAFVYQDKRDDKGHAEITLNYVKELVKSENGDEDVVIPAMILHDVGWSQLPREKRLAIFNSKTTAEEKIAVQLQHQSEGVVLARVILNQVKYPADLTEEILEIISQHDTRKGFISRNEGLVRDADKLWRFSEVGFKANIARTGGSPDLHCEEMEAFIDRPDYFYSEKAKQLARRELALRRKNH